MDWKKLQYRGLEAEKPPLPKVSKCFLSVSASARIYGRTVAEQGVTF
jgi:hypothetical protein